VTPTVILSPLSVALAAKVLGDEHAIVRITEHGALCARCERLLDVIAWAGPCAGKPVSVPV